MTHPPVSHAIEFQNVHFAYEKRTILDGVNFTIPDRTMTAIVGPSGSGKTTICNLIARFWDVNSGRVLIGGQDVKAYTLSELMSNISMVFQNVCPFFFFLFRCGDKAIIRHLSAFVYSLHRQYFMKKLLLYANGFMQSQNAIVKGYANFEIYNYAEAHFCVRKPAHYAIIKPQ